MSDVRFSGSIACNYNEEYTALSYFSFEECRTFHSQNASFTVDLISALTYWNKPKRDVSFFLRLVDEILAKVEDTDYIYYFNDINKSFNTLSEYPSALTQGKLSSLLCRVYKLTREEKYLGYAEKALQPFLLNVRDGGLVAKRKELVWLEEYPSQDQPSMVLNGHVFGLIGLGEYLSLRKEKNLSEQYDKLTKSTMMLLSSYTYNNAVLYSLYDWRLCNVHYLGIAVPLFQHLYTVTGVTMFLEHKMKVEKILPKKLFYQLLGVSDK